MKGEAPVLFIGQPLGLALLVGLLLLPGRTAAAPRQPVLTIRVNCAGSFRSSDGGPIRVSNLGLIGLEIGMHYFEVPPDQASPGPLDLILAGGEGATSTRPPNLEVQVARLAGGARVPAARLQPSGVSGGSEYHGKLPGARYVHAISVWLTIPLDEAAQRASFTQFLDELRRTGKVDEARRFELFQTNPAMLEQLVREHQPGAYELVARYRPRAADYWKTELQTAPLRLDVVAKGHWFDALLTGRAPAGRGCE